RLGDDLEARLEGVLVLDQLQLRGTAAEQLGEKVLEMVADQLEGGEQPLARFAIEILDALPQALDRFNQVVALGSERTGLGLDLAQRFLGAQIDVAQAL